MTRSQTQEQAPSAEHPLEKYLGYHFRRLSAALVADISASLAALELRPSEASILIYMKYRPAQKQSDIGKALGIQRANMAPIIARLESRMLCQRAPVDGRSSSLSLTRQGQQLADRAEQRFDEHEQRCFSSLNSEQRTRLLELLNDQALWASVVPSERQ